MKTIKSKGGLLALLLAVAMLVTFMPTMAFAGSGDVAQIGETTYGTLELAISDAKSNDTIKLLDDITPKDIVKIEGKTITIDLAGKTISRDITGSSSSTYGTASSQPVIWVGNGANLTMTDSVGNGEVKSTTKGAAINVGKYNGGANTDPVSTLTLEAGTYTGAYTGCYAFYNGKIIVDGATVNGDTVGICVRNEGAEVTVNSGLVTNNCVDEAAIQGNGNGSGHGTIITINDGTVIGKGCGIYNPQNGTVNIKGGTITGAASAVEVRAGTINVSGGILTSTASAYSYKSNGNGFTTTGSALAIAQHTTKLDISANITGGSFNGIKAISESNPEKNVPTPKVTMSVLDGEFKGDITIADTSKFISGGLFSIKPDANYITEGNAVISNADYETKTDYPYTIGHTVTFDSDGGSKVKTQEVLDGGYASKPENPTRSGYVFAGWVLSSNGTTFYFDNNAITENITLKALWVAEKKAEGNITVETKDNGIKAVSSAKAADIPLSSDEATDVNNGSKLTVDVIVKTTADAKVTDEAKELIKETLDKNQSIGMYLDLSVAKYLDGEYHGTVSETLNPIGITLTIPENLRANGRVYSIVRVHNGEAEVIYSGKADKNWQISFATDKFSTYALVYEGGTAITNVDTGDHNDIVMYVGMALLALLGIAALALRKRSYNK